MLTVEVSDIRGRLFREIPLSIDMETDEDVPADSLVLRLAGTDFDELMSVKMYKDDILVFSGEVDEQIEVYSTTAYTEITARDCAAKLIDSEAYPMSFVNPSAQDIFECYAKPFGFKGFKGENRVFDGRFTVEKGISCYTAIRRFAQSVYQSFPKCREDTLFIEGIKSNEVLSVGKNGIPVMDIKFVNLRCNRVSRVYLKYKEGEGYDSFVSDSDAEADGICKVRYINLASSGSALKDADVIFDQSKKKSFYADVVCKGFYGDTLGKTVLIDTTDAKYYVSSARYVADKKSEYTKLRLLVKEE